MYVCVYVRFLIIDKKKDGKKKDKDKDKSKVEKVEKPKPIYKSADHFMATHFPAFEGDDDPEASGEMNFSLSHTVCMVVCIHTCMQVLQLCLCPSTGMYLHVDTCTHSRLIIHTYKIYNICPISHLLFVLGPMRTVQLMEVANILETCEESGVHIRESTLRKALMIPQVGFHHSRHM